MLPARLRRPNRRKKNDRKHRAPATNGSGVASEKMELGEPDTGLKIRSIGLKKRPPLKKPLPPRRKLRPELAISDVRRLLILHSGGPSLLAFGNMRAFVNVRSSVPGRWPVWIRALVAPDDRGTRSVWTQVSDPLIPGTFPSIDSSS